MTERLSCLMLPLGGKNILLPVSAVAIVIPFEVPTQRVEGPAWLLGILNWRGISVPLTALEQMDFPLAWDDFDQNLNQKKPTKPFIAMINRSKKIGGEDHVEPTNRYPFFAILVEGTPKLHHVDESNIKIINLDPRLRGDDVKVCGDDSISPSFPRRRESSPNEGERFLMEVKINNDSALIPHLENLWAMIDALPQRLQWFEQIVL